MDLGQPWVSDGFREWTRLIRMRTVGFLLGNHKVHCEEIKTGQAVSETRNFQKKQTCNARPTFECRFDWLKDVSWDWFS